MKKRILSLTMLVLLVMTMSVQAAPLRVSSVAPMIYFNGTTAECSANVRGNTGDQINATITLYQDTTYVDSWSESGTSRILVSGQASVKSRKSYRLVLTYSLNGKTQPSVSSTGT